MELYGQDAELRLLSTLVALLDERSLVDVGAERGSLAEGMLSAGAQEVHAIDPHPDNARSLRSRFEADQRVTVHELAVGDADGEAKLHVSSDADGRPLSFGHTLLERPDTEEISWNDVVGVSLRSLGSLLAAGDLPQRVGILKIDTEGNDLAVVRGMGALDADVVMVEHWTDLPQGLGRCPWTADDMREQLRPRGFAHFAFIVHSGEFVTLKWDDGEVERGAMGNLVFLHDRVLARVLPTVLALAGQLSEQAVRVGQRFAEAASARLALLNELQDTAEERRQALEATTARMNELERAAEERLQELRARTEQMNAQAAELYSLKNG